MGQEPQSQLPEQQRVLVPVQPLGLQPLVRGRAQPLGLVPEQAFLQLAQASSPVLERAQPLGLVPEQVLLQLAQALALEQELVLGQRPQEQLRRPESDRRRRGLLPELHSPAFQDQALRNLVPRVQRKRHRTMLVRQRQEPREPACLVLATTLRQVPEPATTYQLSLIHISEPTRPY